MVTLSPRLTAFSGSVALALLASIACARDVTKLEILGEKYPRAFFFRATEGAYVERRYPTYDSWAENFDRLQGIMGKCLDEECIGREPRNAEFFSRFKKQHPTQAVLLHFNGNARDPRYHTRKYFPGHWIYRKATVIARDVPAEDGESVIHVEDASDFRIGAGRYKTSNDDVALFGITADGTHDWDHCEQLQLLEVDAKANTIKVKRGCYGTKPSAFKAGRSRAAAHEVEGPWGQTNNIMWFYNFSAICPKDKSGKTCADHVVDDLAAWFGPGGALAAFDGLEFDVMFNTTRGDTNGDGAVDDGVIDGVNYYGIGVIEFARQLRERMTDNFIIQGDGALGPGGMRSQRAFGLLNGIESEGFPNLNDWDFSDWSGGMNRHYFWRDNAREPVFNYVNHKWNQSVPGKPGVTRHPDVPFSRHRLALAACQFFDAATCYSFAPRQDPDGLFGIWDELRCGTDGKIGWLGKPEGPATRLAATTPNLIEGQGSGEALALAISGRVKAEATADGVRITSVDPSASGVSFQLGDVPTNGQDLYVAVEMKGEPMRGCPREMARFAQVSAAGGMIDLMAEEPLETGMRLRGASERPIDASTGAMVRSRLTEVDGNRQPVIAVHPPYKNAKGYTFWSQEVDVPHASVLHFSIGMSEKAPERSDGVWFQVFAADVTAGRVGSWEKIFEQSSKKDAWLPQQVSLEAHGGNRVRLKFVADCGPKDNATTDQASWTAARILPAGASDAQVTPAVRYMTWVNDHWFPSSFYYGHIQSPKVNLSFEVEGNEPVVLRSVAAHAHPDVVCRIFEGGVVLANPSRNPYTFDLDTLSPGRKYRRLQGTATQDTQTNNGQPVVGKVTVGERDALFLIRVK
ncbi:MAG: hypothetical protein FJ276_00320 [Planctomycetes bacterium]|nr:hypothetical protein [Planctomycetota bacterium]